MTVNDKDGSDKGTRSLRLPESINTEFNEIKSFGNFERYFGHNFFHSFYTMGVAIAVNDSEFIEKVINDINSEKEFYPKNEKMINSIDSPQLEHHDMFFKMIAYWILMKQNDSGCFRVITNTNLARKICEEIFIRYWPKYYDYLINLGSEYPNVYLLMQYKEKVFSSEKDRLVI